MKWRPAVGELQLLKDFGQSRLDVWNGEYWRLLTALFMHDNFHYSHITFNSIFLLLIGRNLEGVLGARRFLAIFLIAGIAGGLAFQTFSKSPMGIGASGGLYGLLGTLFLLSSLRPRGDRWVIHARFWVLVVLLPLLDYAVARIASTFFNISIALSAHWGGFVAGLSAGYFFIFSPKFPRLFRGHLRRWVIGGAGAAAMIALATHMIFFPPHQPLLIALKKFAEPNAPGFEDAIAEAIRERRTEEFVTLWAVVLEVGLNEAQNGSKEKALPHLRRLKDCWKKGASMRPPILHRNDGYRLYDALRGLGDDRIAAEILDELIEAAREEIKKELPSDPRHRAVLFNELAWYLVLAEKNVREATQMASVAVKLLRAYPEAWWKRILGQSQDAVLGQVVHTLGWAEFLQGNKDSAFRHLREAAELFPCGSMSLYLAIAYASLGDYKEAERHLDEADKYGDLTLYEERLRRELETELGR